MLIDMTETQTRAAIEAFEETISATFEKNKVACIASARALAKVTGLDDVVLFVDADRNRGDAMQTSEARRLLLPRNESPGFGGGGGTEVVRSEGAHLAHHFASHDLYGRTRVIVLRSGQFYLFNLQPGALRALLTKAAA